MPLLVALNSGLTVLYQCITLRGSKVDNHETEALTRFKDSMFFVRIKNRYKKKKIGILNTPIDAVVLEMREGIAGTTIPRTVVSVCYMSRASLL